MSWNPFKWGGGSGDDQKQPPPDVNDPNRNVLPPLPQQRNLAMPPIQFNEPQVPGSAGGGRGSNNNNNSNNNNDSSHTARLTNFDPTALERGVKAIKELNKSPHAEQALNLSMQQERTKQLEYQKQIEQARVQAASAQQSAAQKIEQERRKTLARNEHEQRQTAQQRAKLEKELVQERLQRKSQYDQALREKNHQEFLKQEAIKQENERKLQEQRRAFLLEQAEQDRKTAKIRAEAEAEGQIKRERQNEDILIRKLKAEKEEDRKTNREELELKIKTFNDTVAGFHDTITDPKQMGVIAGALTAVFLGLYTAKTGTGVVGQYIARKLGKPSLVRETSRGDWKMGLFGKAAKQLGIIKDKDIMDGIIMKPELSERLQWIAKATKNTKLHRAPFRHLVFYGHPGTGKTLFAKSMARNSGLHYAMITGGDLGPLGKDAVTELHALFDWAERSKEGTLLFIDEADAFLRKGRGSEDTEFGGGGEMSENMRNVLSAFLHRTGQESDKFQIVLATNMPEIMDPAVMDRIDEKVEFNLPDLSEREAMLRLFFDQFITGREGAKRTLTDALLFRKGPEPTQVIGFEQDAAIWKKLAEQTEGYSGRQLAKFVIGLQSAVYGGLKPHVDPQLAEAILKYR